MRKMRTFELTFVALVPALAATLGTTAHDAYAQAPAGTVDYTVKQGDTCFAIARAKYGDAKYIDLIHQANPGMGPSPHALKEGTVLKLPPKPAGNAGPDAKLDFVRNQVSVEAPSPKPAHKDDPLFRGNRVSTKEASAADVRFAADNAQLRLGEHTLVVILGDSKGAARVGETTLVSGSLRARLGELDGSKKNEQTIATPAAKVKVGTGEAQIHVDAKQTSRLAVYKGKGASITAQNKTVAVPENFGSKAEKGKAPTPPRPLPGAAQWLTAPPGLVFGRSAGADFFGDFGPASTGPAIATWHVQLSKDEGFQDVIVDARLGTTTHRLEARAVPAGDYYARVSGIDDDLFEGPFSVVSVTHVVPFEVVARGRDVVLPAAPGISCGVDGGPMIERATPLSLDGTKAHRIRCASASAPGQGAELDTPIVATAAKEPPRRLSPPALRGVTPPKEPVLITAELGTGLRLTSNDASELGFAYGGGLGLRVPLSSGYLGFGVRLGREEYLERTVNPQQFGGQETKFTHGALIIDGPITYHFGKSPTFGPYLGFSPSVLFQNGTFAVPTGESKDSFAFLLGLTGLVGAELKLGPGDIFGELSYRGATVRQFDFASVGMRGSSLNLGYRFILR